MLTSTHSWLTSAACFVLTASAVAQTPTPLVRISVGAGGAQANDVSSHSQLSADGRYVAFASSASNLLAGDANSIDIFVKDCVTGAIQLVSVASSGVQALGDCLRPYVSANGRIVAFQSGAANLVAGDTNANWDIFAHDRVSHTTERVSVTTAGAESHGYGYVTDVSADGRWIVFTSFAPDLVPDDHNGNLGGVGADVFVHDRTLHTTERVSVANDGGEAQGDSTNGRITPDGRYVVFDGSAANLVAGDTNNWPDVFVRDRVAGTTTRASVLPDGTQGNWRSDGGFVSADGRFVAFTSDASNLSPLDLNGYGSDAFVHDRWTGTTELVQAAAGGLASLGSVTVTSLSADARWIGLLSAASDLVVPDANGVDDAFVFDRTLATTRRLSLDPNGLDADAQSFAPRISGDGHWAVFDSLATNLVANDTNARGDVFRAELGDDQPTVYCVAKTNALGCTPSIHSSGVPSASAGSGFTIGATDIRNNKLGLAFYSKVGSANVPFQGGIYCVQPPTKRTFLQNSLGNVAPANDCSGTFSLDFNAYIASGVDAGLVAGTKVWAQYWSRDPGFAPPNNTNLTNALSFSVQP